MKIVKTGVIDSPLEKVFKCLTDINFYKQDIKHQTKDEEVFVKIQYDRKDPFGIGKTITFLVDDHPVYFMKVIESNAPYEVLIDINLFPDAEALFGKFKYRAQLDTLDNNKTQYTYTYTSIKEPSHWLSKLLAIIAKIYFSFSFSRMNKRFLSFVEEN